MGEGVHIVEVQAPIENLKQTSSHLNNGWCRNEAGILSSSHASGLKRDGDAFSVARRCYVNNLAWNTTWQDLKDHFGQVGKVIYTFIMEDESGRSKGCGIVEFETSFDAARAITKLNSSTLGGRPIAIREDREDRDLKQGGAGLTFVTPSCNHANDRCRVAKRVYVSNLSWGTTWQELKDHFRSVGTTVHASILGHDSGWSKGCGIVEFSSSWEAVRAIECLSGSWLNGRIITVREDREDRDLKDTGPGRTLPIREDHESRELRDNHTFYGKRRRVD